MKISIASSVITKFPETKLGLIIGTGLKNNIPATKISTLARNVEKQARTNYTVENVASIPKIADWRETYRAFGFKPSEHRSSVEALMRRVLQGKELPSINPLVDLYNIISLKYILPAGGGDLAAIDGNITLTIAHGTEPYTMLGQSETVSAQKGEVIYRDDKEVICRAWNYRESNKTKITENTTAVYLIIEGLEHTSHQEIKQATIELSNLASEFCGGTFTTFILDSNNIEITL